MLKDISQKILATFIKQPFFALLVLLVATQFVDGLVLTSPRQISFPTSQAAIATTDLNKDGIQDLISGGDPIGFDFGKIYVLLGNGNGNFRQVGEYTVGSRPNEFSARYVEEIEVADMNNDGNLDVVVAHNSTRNIFNSSSPLFVTVLLGDGNGSLQESDAYKFLLFDSDPTSVFAINLADLNSDGLLDVVIGCWTPRRGYIYLMRNLGAGSFLPMGPRAVIGAVEGMASGYFNSDSNIDVVFSSRQGITLWYGDGNFNFPDGIILQDREDLDDIVSADFNGDGKADFAVAEFLTKRIRVFIKGRRGFPEIPALYDTAFQPDILKCADINGDGVKDLITADGATGGIQIFYGDGNGAFSFSQIVNTTSAADLKFADFDRNGKLDIVTANYSTSTSVQARVFLNAPNPGRYYTDFDGDAKSDLTVYRPSTGTWWTLKSSDGSFRAVKFGLRTDKVVAGNYDGDNKADIAVYRDGIWYILQSSDNSVRIDYWGLSDDIPVPADYENDGIMRPAVFRPSTGYWYIKKDIGFDAIRWGLNTDKPLPADYDGDGKTDIAVFRPSEGVWYVMSSLTGGLSAQQFGLAGDRPVPADFDGDGLTDIAVFRPGDSYWYILQSSTGSVRYVRFGQPDDIFVPNDFDGDGKSDIVVYRPNEGTWYLLRSSDGSVNAIRWGTSGDIPVRTY